jgi:hypothetical protein
MMYRSPHPFVYSPIGQKIPVVLGVDINDILKGKVTAPFVGVVDFTEPTTWLRALPFMGWTSLFLDTFQGLGILGKAAEVATHLAPGLIEGDSVSDAFMADYGARLKLAVTYLIGTGLAAASATAGAYLSSTAGTVGSDTFRQFVSKVDLDKYLNELEAEARKDLGPDRVQQIIDQSSDTADVQINQAFSRLMQDPDFAHAFDPYLKASTGLQGPPVSIPPNFTTSPVLTSTDPGAAAIRASLQNAITSTTSQNLAKLGLSPTDLAGKFNVRADVAALATNAILHRRVYDVSPASFDVTTGAQNPGSDRSTGKNSDWALVDLLDAVGKNAPPDQVDPLRAAYQEALAIENDPHPTDAAAIQRQLQIAQARGAAPDIIKSYQDKLTVASGQPSPDVSVLTKLPGKVGVPFGGGAGAPGGFSITPASLNLKDLPAFALVTAPFWIMFLLLRSRSRRPPSAVRRRRGRT